MTTRTKLIASAARTEIWRLEKVLEQEYSALADMFGKAVIVYLVKLSVKKPRVRYCFSSDRSNAF